MGRVVGPCPDGQWFYGWSCATCAKGRRPVCSDREWEPATTVRAVTVRQWTEDGVLWRATADAAGVEIERWRV